MVIGDEVVRLEDVADGDRARRLKKGAVFQVVVDRLKLDARMRSRFTEAVELAFRQSGGWVTVRHHETGEQREFSSKLVCNQCGTVYPEPTPRLFSFNSPEGACPACRGFGNRLEFDEARIVPDAGLSLREGAVKPWSTESFARQLTGLMRFCTAHKIPLDTPWSKLKREHQLLILEHDRARATRASSRTSSRCARR